MKYELEIYGKLMRGVTSSPTLLKFIKSEVDEYQKENSVNWLYSDLDYVCAYFQDLIIPFFGDQEDWMDNLHPAIGRILKHIDSLGENFSDDEIETSYSEEAIVKTLMALCKEPDGYLLNKLQDKVIALYNVQFQDPQYRREVIWYGFTGINEWDIDDLVDYYCEQHLFNLTISVDEDLEDTLRDLLLA